MMPNLVKGDDVRSGRKAKARYGRHRRQWVKGNTIWTGVIGPVMSLSVVFIDLYFICQKSNHRFKLIFFSVTEDIVLIEIMK